MRNPIILILARLSHPNRVIDPVHLDAARSARVWDALVSIEAYLEEVGK